MISPDFTGAMGAGDWVKDHMKLANCGKTMDRFRREGIADGETLCVLSHFSHNGWADYDELLKPAKKYGFLIERNFKFTLLEIHPMFTSDEAIILRESYWKEVMMSRNPKFGYNSNEQKGTI